MNKRELKEKFEAEFLDGDDINDCGGAMLNAKEIFKWFSSSLLQHDKALIEEIEKCHFPTYSKLEAETLKETEKGRLLIETQSGFNMGLLKAENIILSTLTKE